MKKAIIAGASGMVGSLVLEHCLNSAEIAEVTSLVRRKINSDHPKLKEVLIHNFKDYSAETNSLFKDVDVAFFCIGAYTGQVPDTLFREITVDYAVSFAQALLSNSPEATLCLLSGAGADRTEKSRMAFARYKGMAENKIASMELGGFYSFRPGYIYPVKARKEPSMMYRIARMLYPLLRLMGSNSSIKSTELAKAMFRVGLSGAESEILENKAILAYT